jgi:large subunit ribosomal protein L4
VAQVPIYNDKGKAVGKATIADRIAAREPHPQVIRDYVVAVQANERQWSANTRDRSLVRGSTAKPWRQKGTGRARAGTRKSPIFRGGGTIHGPKPKQVRVSLPRKVRRLALETALADALRDERLRVLDRLEIAEPRTRLVAALLKSLKLNGNVLLVGAEVDETVRRAARNIPNLVVKAAGNVSAMDVLRARTVVLTSDALGPLGLTDEAESAPAEDASAKEEAS